MVFARHHVAVNLMLLYICSFSLISIALTAILAMVWSGSVVVYVAMSFSLLLSSSATVQRFRLSRQESKCCTSLCFSKDYRTSYILYILHSHFLHVAFREVCNHVREEVNRLQVENNHLTLSLNNLALQVSKLHQAEANLADIVDKQGTNTNTFIYEVKQNAIVQEEIQQLLVTEVVHNMLSALLRADRDQDYMIDPEEVDVLILRVKALPGVEGVDEARIKEILLKKGNGLDAILEVVTELTAKKDGSKALVQVSAKGLIVPQ